MEPLAATPLLGLYGAGAFGRECLPLARYAAAHHLAVGAQFVFVEQEPHAKEVANVPVWSHQRFLDHSGLRYFSIAIADSRVRARLAGECIEGGASPLSLVSELALQYSDASIGAGVVQCPFSTISSEARIGRFVHLNFGVYVAHDCVIGDFVTFAPAAQCLGRVHIGEHAFVGAGAVIHQGTREQPRQIGANAIIGMGAMVLEDVPEGSTVVGNPARPI